MTSFHFKSGICTLIFLFVIASVNTSLCNDSSLPDQTFGDSLIQVMEITDSICLNQSNGYIHIALTDSTNQYNINWSNGESSMYVNDLEAGQYSVTVSNNQGINESRQFTIATFPQSTYNLVNDISSCESETSIQVMTPPGSIPIQHIEWSTGDQSTSLENIPHGFYSVSLTDMYGCNQEMDINTNFIDTTSPTMILRNLSMPLGVDGRLPILFPEDFIMSVSDNCEGTIDIFPEQILLNCDHVGNNKIEIIAFDDYGNKTIDSLEIEVIDIHEPLVFCPAGQHIYSCDTVYYGDPYSFDNCNNIDVQLIDGLPSGSVFPQGENILIFQATDQSGNTSSCQTTIKVDYGIDYQISTFEASCYGSLDGAMVIQTSGLNGPTQFEIENFNGDLLSMPAGIYPITFTDSLGCSVLDTAVIESPEALLISNIQIISPQDFDGQNGWIDIQVLGGVAPYNFTWYLNGNIISQDQNPSNLNEGAYIVQIRDSYHCEYISHGIEIGQSTDVEIVNIENDINIFPNPAHDIINISLPTERICDEVEVYSLTGQLIDSFNQSDSQIQIPVSQYKDGTYILRLKIGKQHIHKRFTIID